MMYKEYTIGGELYHSSAGIKNKVYKYIDKIRTKSGKWRYIYENAKTGVKNTAARATDMGKTAYAYAGKAGSEASRLYKSEVKPRAEKAIDSANKGLRNASSEASRFYRNEVKPRAERAIDSANKGLRKAGAEASNVYKNEIKPGVKRAHKYIDKVLTKNGKWRYIYKDKGNIWENQYMYETHMRDASESKGAKMRQDIWDKTHGMSEYFDEKERKRKDSKEFRDALQDEEKQRQLAQLYADRVLNTPSGKISEALASIDMDLAEKYVDKIIKPAYMRWLKKNKKKSPADW